MATRFRLTADNTAPAVSPTLQSYSHTSSYPDPPGNVRKLLTSDSSTLATTAYTPDGADHLVAGDSLHCQFVSAPLASGIAFTNGDTIKCAVQGLEAHTSNNLFLQLYVSVVSEDGATVRRVLRSKVADGTEFTASITNRFLSTTQDGATYTTVTGDRLVVEFSVTGTPAGSGGVQGHNASLRWGGSGAGGDNGENDTDTGATLNPWIEFVPTFTAVEPIVGTLSSTLGALTAAATATVAIAATAAITLGAATLSATGVGPTTGTLSPQVFSLNGIWTWFNDPRSVYDSSRGLLYVGALQANGVVRVHCFDVTNGVLRATGYPRGQTVLEVDDHNNPALCLLTDGKLLVAFSQHNGDSFSVRTTNAGDISTWDSPVAVASGANDDSYAHLMQMGDTANTVVWFYRRGTTEPKPVRYRTSTDGGATWGGDTDLLQAATSTHCYFKCARTSGSRIDFVVASGHPDETGAGSLYHGYVSVASNGAFTFFQSDATQVTSPPYTPDEFSLIYDGSSTNADGWQWDIENISGTPVITYVVLESTNTVHRYYQARWSGSAWQSDEVTTGGTTGTTDSLDPSSSVQYSGGIAIDPNDINTVYVSREYGSGDFRLEKWTHTGTFPSGTWAKDSDVSGNTGTKNARPYCPRGLSPTRVIWWEGTYTSYVSYSTRLRMSPAFAWKAAKQASPVWTSSLAHPGVQSYFLMHEGTGTSIADLKNARNGTFVGTPDWQTHTLGAYLNGWTTSDYVQINSVATSINFTSYPSWFAILFRNSNSTDGSYIWSAGNSGDTTPHMAGIFNGLATSNNGGAYLRDNAGSELFADGVDAQFSDGKLHVLMGSRSAVNRLDTYLDGVLVGTDSGLSPSTITVDRGAIGCLVRVSAQLATAADIFCFIIGHGSAPDPDYLTVDLLQGQFVGTFDVSAGSITGTLSSTLGALTATGTGTVAIAGSTTATLGALTSTATGTVAITGATNVTLGSLTSAATGTVAIVGSTNTTLGALTSTSTGTVAIQGATNATLGALTLTATGTGQSGNTGTLNATLGTLTATGTGTVAVSGTSAITLGTLTSTATGTVAIVGTTTATLGTLTASGTGTVAITGSTNATLGTLTLSATGTAQSQGTGILNVTLGALTSTATGTVAIAGSLTQTLSPLTTTATGTVAITGATSATLGTLTLSGSGSVGTLNTNGTLNATLGSATATATGTVAIQGSGAITLDALTAASTGTVLITGSLNVTLDPLSSIAGPRIDLLVVQANSDTLRSARASSQFWRRTQAINDQLRTANG